MRIYKEAEIAIPTDVNLTELLHTSAGNLPLPESHLVAKDSLTNRSITLGELRDRAGRLANGLQKKLRPRQGDRWAVILPNCVEYIECFHALLWAGGTGCPINHALRAAEIAHALEVTQPRFILAYGPALEKIKEGIALARKEMDWAEPTIVTVIQKSKGHLHFPDDVLDDERLAIPHYADTDQHIASIHLSSGTTGQPKGVQLTHYNLVSNCYQMYAHDPLQFGPSSRTVVYTPFVHIAMTTPPLFLGPWTGMMHHAMPSFDLETFGQLVQSTQATCFQGVPSVLLAFANSDITTRYDFSSAKTIMAGSVLKDDLIQRLQSRAPWRIVQLYGMTEASPFVAHQKLHEDIPPGAAGKLLPNLEARLVKEGSTHDAPEGGPGELWLRGPNITRGYCHNDAANAAAFPEPGWYNTGDVCTISPDGILAVVGRTKELIKYKGFQVAPAELEAHLNVHPHVAEAGVAAVWCEEQLTELPTAYVVLKQHLRGDGPKVRALKEIHADIDGLVVGYKKLRGGVWEVDRLPKNATGKILRKELPERRVGRSSLDAEQARARL